MSRIARIYRKTRKRPDLLWNTYVARPVAAVVVYAVRRTPVTPNQVTLLSAVVAAEAAAGIVLASGYVGLLVSIVVFELSYVLDCADGMLARLRHVQSANGHLLDFLMDEIKAFAILAAVSVRLYRAGHDSRFLLLGIAGLVCLASGVALTTFLRRPEIVRFAAAPLGPRPRRSLAARAVGATESVAKFLIHYPSYILIAALAGHIEYYFYPYIAVNALYVARALATVTLRFGRAT